MAEACALQPDSISAYAITPEEGTELVQRIARGEWSHDEDREAVLFLLTCRFLEARDYASYEVSNFSRPGHECRHHQSVWSGEDYLGLGPGAVSTVAGRRWRNLRDTGSYAQSWLLGSGPRRQEEEERDPSQIRTERILLGLRTRAGLAEQGLPGREEWLETLVRKGWARREGGRFHLTARGRLRADEVAAILT
jgi:oxygen-independent coproporphyrinogen-3 oxidase